MLGDPKNFRPIYIMTDIWRNTGYTSIVYLAALTGVDRSLYEAAEIDGANQFQAFSMLILPLIVPAIFMVGLLSFVGIWNEYIMSITFIKDQAKYTLSVGINELMNDATAGETLKFAALIIAMLPILIVYAIFQKPLQDGLSSSDGVKG